MPARLTASRWQLGLMLQRLRERARISQVQAGSHIGVSDSKLSRVEQGVAVLTQERIKRLLDIYQATQEERDAASALGVAARQRSDYQRKNSLPDVFQRFADLEANATEIFAYEASVIPGLLQCPDYARSIMESAGAAWWPEEQQVTAVQERLAFRLERQNKVWGSGKQRLHFVIGEAALLANTGGSIVMQRQLSHLLMRSHEPATTIQVLPLSAPSNPVPSAGYTMLNFGDLVNPVGIVYSAYGPSTFYIDKSDTESLARVFTDLAQMALPPQETRTTITAALSKIGSNV